jgi:menaquinol-cytochrome c reductase iron-sulfur subunit
MAKEPENKPTRPAGAPAAAPRSGAAASTPSTKDRRDFVAVVGSMVTGTLAIGASVGAGIATLLDPLVRKKSKPGYYAAEEAADGSTPNENSVLVTTLDAVPDDGVPRRFPVLADRVDAWTFTASQPIGAVYIRREPGESTVTVFHSTCPHAGCSVSFKKEESGEQVFFCPCHNSAFEATGKKRDVPGRENPSPRDLDTLNVDEAKLAQGEIWVEYVDFYTGQHEKKQKI